MLILHNFLRIKTLNKYSYIISKQSSNQIGTKPVKLVYADYNKNASSQTPLMLLHGLFGSKGNWKAICKSLEKKLTPSRRIIAVDLRNHGGSEHSNIHNYEALTIDVKHLLQQLNINKVCFLAHSMGGRAAMLFTLLHPGLVDRLILVDISPVSSPKDLSGMQGYFKAMRNAPIVNQSLTQARINADKYMSATIKNKDVRSFLLGNLVKINGKIKWRLNLDILENNFEHITTFPLATVSGKTFDGPVTFIRGGLSPYVIINDLGKIKQLFPAATIKTIENAGHWLHSEKTKEFQDVVIKCLQ